MMRRFMSVYRLTLVNEGPLHIGNGEGDILLDENDFCALIPGTSLAGALRDFVTSVYGEDAAGQLFGSRREAADSESSKLKISEMQSSQSAIIEYRPGVRINGAYGSAEQGGKFDRCYLSPGSEFLGRLSVSANSEKELKQFNQWMEAGLAAIEQGMIRIGAYKSSGGGKMRVSQLKRKSYDLFHQDDYFNYLTDRKISSKDWGGQLTLHPEINGGDCQFTLALQLKTPMLIGGDVEEERKWDSQASKHLDAVSMRNQSGKFYIPGTSLRGVLRHHIARIADIYHNQEITNKLFGSSSDNQELFVGKLQVSDAEIEKLPERPQQSVDYHRIHINKLTGGVMKGALLTERAAYGRTVLNIFLQETEDSDQLKAIVLLALRDLAEGTITLGGGSAQGFGYLRGETLTVKAAEGTVSVEFANNSIQNEALANQWLGSLRREDEDATD